MLEPLIVALRAIVTDPAHLATRIHAFLALYWAGPDEALPWDTPLHEAVHWLGNDLQDYEPSSQRPVEPTLLRDGDVLSRVAAVLRLADTAASGTGGRA